MNPLRFNWTRLALEAGVQVFCASIWVAALTWGFDSDPFSLICMYCLLGFVIYMFMDNKEKRRS